MYSSQYIEPAQEIYIKSILNLHATQYWEGERKKKVQKNLHTLQQIRRQVQTHLLGRNIKRDGPHINFDEAVCAGQDKKQTCTKKSIQEDVKMGH